jgi:hypothetical protein
VYAKTLVIFNYDEGGQCRRFPPVSVGLHALKMLAQGRGAELLGRDATEWPETLQDQWCGEHRPQETPEG